MQAISQSKVVAAPNVVPMIDVMLVLLIIFMVVTPTLMSGVIAEPPVGEHLQARPVSEDDHTLAIDIHGALYLDKRPISGADLRAALSALYPAREQHRVLYIRAHRELPFGRVDETIDVARARGVAVVGLVTEQKRVPE